MPSDIELSSHIMPTQPLHERFPLWSLSSETNSVYDSAANSIDIVDEVEPPTPAYFPPSNNIPPIPYRGLLRYTQLHRNSEIPNSGYPPTTLVEPPACHDCKDTQRFHCFQVLGSETRYRIDSRRFHCLQVVTAASASPGQVG